MIKNMVNDIDSERFAYLIIAHNEPYILHKLISLLDDPRNDIFLLIDKKSNLYQFKNLNTLYSKLIMCDPLDIRWGDLSQIQAELKLFETAYSYAHYKYFHLISGVDFPIKSQDYIHNYFQSPELSDKEFLHYVDTPGNQKDLIFKTNYYHLFTRWFRPKSFLLKILLTISNKSLLNLQKILRISRKYPLYLRKGMQWCSLTSKGVKLLLDNKIFLLKTFKYTWCPDEIFIQSLFWTFYDHDKIHKDPIRLIDWQRGKPYTFNESDSDELMSSPMLFARKFSTSTLENKNIVDLIYKKLKNEKQI